MQAPPSKRLPQSRSWSPPSDTLNGAREAVATARSLSAAGPPSPLGWGWPPGLTARARLRRIPAVLSSDRRLIWPPGRCASAGSPQLSTKCEGQRFPSLNKSFSVFLKGWGAGLHLFFLSSLGPLLVPGNQPQPVASQRMEPESRPVSQCPISEYRLQELAGQVEAPEGCVPGEGLAGRREGPPFPAPTALLSGSLSWPALTSTCTRALGLDLPEPEAVLSRCPPHLLPPRVARPAPQCLVRLQN